MPHISAFLGFRFWRTVSLFWAAIALSCAERVPDFFQGYVEGEFVYVSSPVAGRLEVLNIHRGQEVRKGDLLFRLESDFREDAVQEALRKQNQATHKLANLQKGKRPSEIKALEAALGKAKAGFKLAETEYLRRVELSRKQFISEEQLDKARTQREQQLQQVRLINAELETARLGARPDEIKAAQAEVKVAKARLAQAQWNLDQKTQRSRRSGVVFDTFYDPGEWVAAGQPVASILPPENVKVRFFVPEKEVGKLSLGRKVLVLFDGGGPVRAEIGFISPRAQYTPPVIYSSKSRAKLVFMVEARPDTDSAHLLHPGQPVDVRAVLQDESRE